MFFNNYLLMLCFALVVLVNSAASYYFISTPRIYKAGEEATFSIHGIERNRVKINLKTSDKYKKDTYTHLKLSDSGTLHKLIVPKNSEKKAEVQVRVDNESWQTMNVLIEKLEDVIFIQTDKPAYKPQDKVQFRVVIVDKNLRPPKERILPEVYVVNAAGSRVMQWTNVTLTYGIISLDLTLSKKPVLGLWKIIARYQNIKKEQTINVEKYGFETNLFSEKPFAGPYQFDNKVLPKFEVSITPPSYISTSMKDFTMKICAKYTYGKLVDGDLKAKICVFHQKTRYWHDVNVGCITIDKKIKGCSDIPYSLQNKLSGNRFYSVKAIVNATVTEKSTGVSLNSTHEEIIHTKDINVRLQAPEYFKPGFPLIVKILVTTPDGRPASNVNVAVAISGDPRKSEYTRTFNVNNGMALCKIRRTVSQAKSYEFTASYKELVGSRSIVTSTATVNQFYSKSDNYLEIRDMKYLEVGKTAAVNVRFNDNRDTVLKYLLVCKGKIVLSDEKTISLQSHTHIHFKVTEEMVPKCRFLVYYVDPNGEFISDYKIINFKLAFKNKVSLSFTDSERKPGERSSLVLKASAGSRFAVSAVDRSTQLLGSSSDLKEEQISELLHQQDVPGKDGSQPRTKCPNERKIYRCPRGFGCFSRNRITKDKRLDGRETIKEAGLLYFSNAEIDVLRCPKRRPMPVIDDFGWRRWTGPIGRPEEDSVLEDSSIPRRLMDLRLNYFKTHGNYLLLQSNSNSRKRNKLKTKLEKKTEKKSEKKTEKKTPVQKKPVKIRRDFPETWIWSDFDIDNSGEKTISVKLPDTITTWFANGFAISPTDGLGVATSTSIQSFQPFFVSLQLPYSVIRGETVKIPATVFNYLDDCVVLQVSLAESPAYDIISSASKKMCVCSSQSNSYKFAIKPKTLGRIDINVQAISTTADQSLCGQTNQVADIVAVDAITKKLLVEAEGIKKDFSTSTFFCPKDYQSGIYQDNLAINLPDAIVPGSVFTELSIVGDLMGPSLDNIDKLLAMPYGCGEQNMLKFAPNIYVMDYLKATDQLTDEIANKAKGFMRSGEDRKMAEHRKNVLSEDVGIKIQFLTDRFSLVRTFILSCDGLQEKCIYFENNPLSLPDFWTFIIIRDFLGYQRELTYKHNDGAYSAFGRGEGSTWLTAFVLRSYAQAQRYIFIDKKDIQDSITWLLSNQDQQTGCFKELGMVHHIEMKGGVTSGITMTAFVLNALLEAGISSQNVKVKKALECIESKLNDVSDPYTTSILAYTLSLAGSEKRQEMLEKLQSYEEKTDGLIYWEKEKKKASLSKSRSFVYHYRAPSANIEMTAYALMSYIGGLKKFSSPLEHLRIVKWLVKQRNPFGGFSSTQDTCVALQALSNYAASNFGGGFNLDIITTSDIDGFEKSFTVADSNKLVVQKVELPSVTRNVVVEASGKGCALAQVDVKYNIPEPKDDDSFVLNVHMHPEKNSVTCKHKMKVCGSYTGDGKSNMVLIDVAMVSGFEPIIFELDMLTQSTSNTISQYEFEDGILSFYFDEFEQQSKCVEFNMEQVAEVAERKPASVKIYDYYDTEKSTTQMYQVGSCPEINAV